jgi:hypothetical protein
MKKRIKKLLLLGVVDGSAAKVQLLKVFWFLWSRAGIAPLVSFGAG